MQIVAVANINHLTLQIKMTPIDELIEFIETWGNGTSDRNKELTVNDIYEYAQALQLLQPDVIKSVCSDKNLQCSDYKTACENCLNAFYEYKKTVL